MIVMLGSSATGRPDRDRRNALLHGALKRGTDGWSPQTEKTGARRARMGPAGLAAAALCAGLLFSDSVLAQTSDRAEDDVFWESVKSCTDGDEVRMYLGKFPNGAHAPKARQCLTRLQTGMKVKRLLKECEAHRAADRLTRGRGGNALDCYEAVLKLDRGNRQALAGIAAIRKHYVDKANTAVDEERVSAAKRAIGVLEEINPEDRKIEDLRARLGELKERIAARKRLEALRRQVEDSLAQGKPGQARSLLSKANKEGFTGKGLAALEKRVEDALKEKADRARALASKVAEVKALLAKGDHAGGRRALKEARRLGLDAQTGRELEAAIEKSGKRTAALAAFRGALARRDYAAARAALDRARALGLPEAAYRTHLAAIDKRKAEDLQRSAGSCAAHEAAGRLAAALDCYRKVLAQQPDDAVAKAKVRTLVPRVAWSAAQAKNTAEAYHAFLQAHSGSAFAGAARQRLEDLEIPNWRVAKAANTRAAYARFLKFYPNGTFAGIAKKRLSERAN